MSEATRLATPELTADIARELLEYDPDTGVLTWRWRDRKWFKTDGAWASRNALWAGKPAGSDHPAGYRKVNIAGKFIWVHRLIWLMQTGAWPAHHIDHIDHDTSNNRWENLREATPEENARNQRRNVRNKSGRTGVHQDRSGRWWARVRSMGERLERGPFKEFWQAELVRTGMQRAAGDYHPNHGVDLKAGEVPEHHDIITIETDVHRGGR
ncbi:HNH endonuclease signature motif containing protein [Ancylobacter amanitiformis]|uniref:HNH nuclease domain-containing protein n=1 Tax=Ancylobacter amanitiformis TaxID=217069 RepID=A0ABU0LSU6_9HYPH|nr:HNH endonuclease signature motif containing protein [Ancylobacter amanitiformis]MDQ0511663.1 hypothetical protein [Ancylobacter amanitiformis]